MSTVLKNGINMKPGEILDIPKISNANKIEQLIQQAQIQDLHTPLTRSQSLELAQQVQSLLPPSEYTHDEKGQKFELDMLPSERWPGDNLIQTGDNWPYIIRLLYGIVITINFLIFWTLPNLIHGIIWHNRLDQIGGPLFRYFDQHPQIRAFAAKYIYVKESSTDYFMQSVFTLTNWLLAFSWILSCQRNQNDLTWTQIFIYFTLWVGIRGGGLGATFALMHYEGHHYHFYKPYIRNTIGNIFEDWLSPVYGTVPGNASISHTYLHHATQGRSGDSFYQCDINRTLWGDFMILLHRIALHQLGITPLIQMHRHGLHKQRNLFLRGLLKYFIIYPTILYYISNYSISFLFWIYIQPHLCLVFISCWANLCFHSFIDYSEDGQPIECVFATDAPGADDWFGDDNHMSHHISGHVFYTDIDKNRTKMKKYFSHYHASVFKDLGVSQFSGLLLGKKWDQLATYFVQYHDNSSNSSPHSTPNCSVKRLSEDDLIQRAYFEAKHLANTTKPSVFIGQGKLTLKEIAVMLEVRSTRREPKWSRYTLLNAEYNALPLVKYEDLNHTDTKMKFD